MNKIICFLSIALYIEEKIHMHPHISNETMIEKNKLRAKWLNYAIMNMNIEYWIINEENMPGEYGNIRKLM